MTTTTFGSWQVDIDADGRVTLADRRGTVVRLRYVQGDRGRHDLKEVQIEAAKTDLVSGRCWRRIPFVALERHMNGHHVTEGQQSAERPTIATPENGLTDDFLKSVAEAYLWATSAGLHPAPSIAELAEVPVRRVHRWVSDARKRGFLPPARPGRAG